MLTKGQAELVLRIARSGSRPVLWTRSHQGDSVIGEKDRWAVNSTDFRELVDQGILRPAGGDSFELTNAGRAMYMRLTAPPPNPVGFKP